MNFNKNNVIENMSHTMSGQTQILTEGFFMSDNKKNSVDLGFYEPLSAKDQKALNCMLIGSEGKVNKSILSFVDSKTKKAKGDYEGSDQRFKKFFRDAMKSKSVIKSSGTGYESKFGDLSA